MPAEHDGTHRIWETVQARLDALETQASFQEELLNTLNDQVSHQQLAMGRLWDANRLLQDQLRSLQRGNTPQEENLNEPEPPPPHY
ncbi:MAG: SlyX family protein [Oleiphilaceae bacterium]|nr:SlyX family protein [Oleiphilaceae bacterium]